MILKGERVLLEEHTLAGEELRSDRGEDSPLEGRASRIGPALVSVGRHELLLTPTKDLAHSDFLRQLVETDVSSGGGKLFEDLLQLLLES